MRGRKPSSIYPSRADREKMRRISRSLTLPWFQVRSARIVLAVASGQRTQAVAAQMQCAVDTVRRTCRRYDALGLSGLLTLPKRSGRPAYISPLQRAQIVQLACLEPVAKGLHITHWSSADLARQARCDGIVPTISPRSIRRILQEVDLQPHRTRSWKTAALNAEFMKRAIRVLWCYTYAESLARRGFWIVCSDELPNFQVLERQPIRRAIPGSIEQQEFEYKRHGTVNVLVFLVVHTGQMYAECLKSKDAPHYTSALRHFRRHHRNLRGVYLIHDSDPSHTGGITQNYFRDCSNWWRPCPIPVHASWLNQAELLLDAFEFHYLKRGSWSSPQIFLDHIQAAWPEYNRRYAHPFDWQWSIPKMRSWFAEHAS
jgi:transposase